MSVKALGIALKLTFSGVNQLFYPQTWAFALIVATCVSTQINYLNKVNISVSVVIDATELCIGASSWIGNLREQKCFLLHANSTVHHITQENIYAYFWHFLRTMPHAHLVPTGHHLTFCLSYGGPSS